MFVFVKDGRRDSTCRNTHSSSHFVNDSVHDHKKNRGIRTDSQKKRMKKTSYLSRLSRQIHALCKKNFYIIGNSKWTLICMALIPGNSSAI